MDDTQKDTRRAEPQRHGSLRVPRWVTVFAIVTALLLALLLAATFLGGGGQHSPAQHLSVSATNGPVTPTISLGTAA